MEEDIIKSLRASKERRDDLLHEDEFNYHLDRFVDFCQRDPLVMGVIEPLSSDIDIDSWWEAATRHRGEGVTFPESEDEELYLRYRILEDTAQEPRKVSSFGISQGHRQRADWENSFRSIIIRPFVHELTHRLGEAADLATPEARAMQAVPLNRIPSENESQIFLSHKSVDKPLVYRYFHALESWVRPLAGRSQHAGRR